MPELLDRRKQAKLKWLQNPSLINGDNRDNVRREASRTFRTKRGGGRYQKDEINHVETNRTKY
jgi:hypothetical protein